MTKRLRISEAEGQVMKVLWGQAPLTAAGIARRPSGSCPQRPRTGKTLLNQFLRKGVVSFRRQGRMYRYFPVLVVLPFILCCSTPSSQLAHAPGPPPGALAALAPQGFTPFGQPLYFGTETHPLKDGNIFKYIDGGGMVYLDHGFTDLFHAEYGDDRRNTITLDVYGMSTPGQARQALADERICPAAASSLDFDTSGKSYRFPPDYFFYFVQGRRLVYLHVSDDRLSARLARFGAMVKSILEKEEP